jgi:hypothetical protein
VVLDPDRADLDRVRVRGRDGDLDGVVTVAHLWAVAFSVAVWIGIIKLVVIAL